MHVEWKNEGMQWSFLMSLTFWFTGWKWLISYPSTRNTSMLFLLFCFVAAVYEICVNNIFIVKPIFFSTCFTGWHSHRDLWDSELANRASRYPINCDVERSLQLQHSWFVFCCGDDLQPGPIHQQFILVQPDVLLWKGPLQKRLWRPKHHLWK